MSKRMGSTFNISFPLLKKAVLLFTLSAFICSGVKAADEPYINELKGSQVSAGNFFTVTDEKFTESAFWNLIDQNISVDDMISFEINFDTSIYFYKTPFEATINFTVYMYGNQKDTSAITDSVTHAGISLQLRYDTASGNPYKGVALYKFKGTHKYKVKINSIKSPQLNPLPAIFRLKGQIIINRQYVFKNTSADITRYAIVHGNQLQLQWAPSNYPGAESFDIEYTHIDDSSIIAGSIRMHADKANGYTLPADTLALWFTNNSTRINTSAASYLLNTPFEKGFVLFRIRGVQVHYPDGVRWEGDWNYSANAGNFSCTGNCPSGVVYISSHEPRLNWQYSAAFAEEGKKKEVISYFDGLLHNRQSVTLSNTDNKSIVQETVYDNLGRPAINVLPVPENDSTLHYFGNFNRNGSNLPYSYADFTGTACTIIAKPMSSSSGASRYYSENNSFLSTSSFARYVPKADNYPFSVTEYMADNTGRIRTLGGVGPLFQLNSNHDTKYFYGKPQQEELDRLFGMEAGNASHYLKNMVVDPNGQINVSYIDAGGRTIATALAGQKPANMHPLESGNGTSTQITANLIQPGGFSINPGNHSLSASSTFLAPVPGDYWLNYQVDPLKLEVKYGAGKDRVICNTCYYDLQVIVKNSCGDTLGYKTDKTGAFFDTACSSGAQPIKGTLQVKLNSIGDYFVTYNLIISVDALDFYDSVHLVKNTDIRTFNSFMVDELKETDFTACYSNCETCLIELGTHGDFLQRFKKLYGNDAVPFSPVDSFFVLSLYDSLLMHCKTIQAGCKPILSACDERLAILKMDVSPGGQYALHDSTFKLTDLKTNILAKRAQVLFLPDENGNPDTVRLTGYDGQDSLVDARALNDSLFIAHWKDSWADSLVKFHPEYCYYLWCTVNPASAEFDARIRNLTGADSAAARQWFNAADYGALLKKDPFFNTINGITGKGAYLYARMNDSLRLFSRSLVHYGRSDKNILQFIDVVLYCKTQPDGWDGCRPDSACRSRNREWEIYKQLYLNLKLRFNEEARRNDPDFAACSNCFIGSDMGSVVSTGCAKAEDFKVTDYISYPPTKDNFGVPYIPVRLEITYKDGSSYLTNQTTVWYKYHCLILPKIGWNVVFEPGETVKTLDIRDYNPDCRKELSVTCASDTTTPAYTPFTDSTCNYTCPDGIYPGDREKVSFFIAYGTPLQSPAAPAGYENCRFYPVFELKTGADSKCKFFNVWVCTYDSTCKDGNCPPAISYPSSCGNDISAAFYASKVRRYPDYVNTDQLIANAGAGNPSQGAQANEQAMAAEYRSNCEAQADVWIKTLKGCTADDSTLSRLKKAFIDICTKGSSYDHPYGSSSIPLNIPATYHGFEEAMNKILGAGAINDSCSMELLASPFPYDKQPLFTSRVVVETDYLICRKIAAHKTDWQTSGSKSSFHQYLEAKFSSSYGLDSTELNDLLKSCTQCNGILQNNIVLPAVFEPGITSYLNCTTVQAGAAAFHAKFPALNSTKRNYEALFTNFMNHRYGFSLGYADYITFMDSCTTNKAITLVNKPMQEETEIDHTGECTAALFATALTNAQNIYTAYIDSVHTDFRDAYMTKCMNVQAGLTMTATLYEYHYTLYYYDQSANLVKTVPPAGVQLLNDKQVAEVKQYRNMQNESCYKYSDDIRFANDGYIDVDSAAFQYNQYHTVEAFIQLNSHANQTIYSTAKHFNFGGADSVRYLGYEVSVNNSKLTIDLYGVQQKDDSTKERLIYNQVKISAQSALPLTALLPTSEWRHLVIQHTMDVSEPWQVLINGNIIKLNYTGNWDGAGMVCYSSGMRIGASADTSHTAGQKVNGIIKNIRIYNRFLPVTEVRQNAFNACQLPANTAGLHLWAPLTKIINGNTIENLQNAKAPGRLTGGTWEPHNGIFPDHKLTTNYQYNSLNQVMEQYSPDGGTTRFWYDGLGRLVASQNMEQLTTPSYSGPANRYSYTKYDALGRMEEVGEKSNAAEIKNINMLSKADVDSWVASGTNKQVTKTIYDEPVNLLVQSSSASRKRVTASVYLENKEDREGDSTLYAYDVSGNVKTLLQHNKALVAADPQNGNKRIDYDYDLVSGKVNRVNYQPGKGDQFFYKYAYDADNRIRSSYSSRDELVWTEDAAYQYYLHGPLARTELGHYKVQGIDYAYTLQGWLKGINGDALDSSKEMGGDALAGSVYSRVSKDVYAFKLGYFTNDYNPVGGSTAPAFSQRTYDAPSALAATGNSLFNGNISLSTLALSKINGGATTGYTYGYDQLNRLTEMRQHSTNSNWGNSSISAAYSESIAYDANGNILKYLRNGAGTGANPLDMDSLTYKYNRNAAGNLVNNRLNHVRDAIKNNGNYTVDIDNQSGNNYIYDSIGNLKKDVAEGIQNINWTVYGKIRSIDKEKGITLNYSYDPGGNRIIKEVNTAGQLTKTFYVRDAQGNVMGIYTKNGSNPIHWNEQHLYGSSRLGMWNWDTVVPLAASVIGSKMFLYDSLLYGSRMYELTNHLGNVLVTVSDKKVGVSSSSTSGIIGYYEAEVISAQDYYPFGMLMPGRQNGTLGRYGFNGKENDNELKGAGNSLEFKFRVYEPRLGKFLSVDPLTSSYPWNSPYAYAENRVVDGVDLEGLEYATVIYKHFYGSTKPVFNVIWHSDLQRNTYGKLGKGVAFRTQHYDRNGQLTSTSATTMFKRNAGIGGLLDHGFYYGPTQLPNMWLVNNYKLISVDAVDEAARLHDWGYDAVGATAKNATKSWGTIEADKALITATSIVGKLGEGGIDPFNGQIITEDEWKAANRANVYFALTSREKIEDVSDWMIKNYSSVSKMLTSPSNDSERDLQYNYYQFRDKYMHRDSKTNLWKENDGMWKTVGKGDDAYRTPKAPDELK